MGSRELSRCSSGSSLRRLGGTVVMRIFTVASAELISKPVSLVSMVRTGGTEGEFLMEGLKNHGGNSKGGTYPGWAPGLKRLELWWLPPSTPEDGGPIPPSPGS